MRGRAVGWWPKLLRYLLVAMAVCALAILLLVAATVFSAPDTLPDDPIPVYRQDRVWIIDGATNAVALGPFHVSGFLNKNIIGDAQIGPNQHLYVSISEVWVPEKGSGTTVLEIDPITSKRVGEITVRMRLQRLVMTDSKTAYVNTLDSVAVLDLEQRRVALNIPLKLPCPLQEMIVDPHGTLYVGACEELSTIDTVTSLVSVSTVSFADWIDDLAMAPNGLLYVLLDRQVELVDPGRREAVGSIALETCHALYMSVSSHGKAYVTCSDRSIVVIDMATGEVATRVPLPHRCFRMVVSSNGNVYLMGAEVDMVWVLDGESDQIVAEIALPRARRW